MRTSLMMVAALVAGISGLGLGSIQNASDAATPGSKRRRAGYGRTNRHAQRVALKARNQVKHRARGKSRRAS
jgi:hypothetical protein